MTRPVDLMTLAPCLDDRHAWHGPAAAGPGGTFALTRGRNAPGWTVHRIDTDARRSYPCGPPFHTHAAAQAAAEDYAADRQEGEARRELLELL